MSSYFKLTVIFKLSKVLSVQSIIIIERSGTALIKSTLHVSMTFGFEKICFSLLVFMFLNIHLSIIYKHGVPEVVLCSNSGNWFIGKKGITFSQNHFVYHTCTISFSTRVFLLYRWMGVLNLVCFCFLFGSMLWKLNDNIFHFSIRWIFFFTKIADIKFYSSRFKLYIKLLKNINLSTGSYLLIITKPAIWLGNYYAKKK